MVFESRRWDVEDGGWKIDKFLSSIIYFLNPTLHLQVFAIVKIEINAMKTLKRSNIESGQAIIILVMIMLVALTLGVGVISRSITSLSTSSKTEAGSRAYSAAQAGLDNGASTATTNPNPFTSQIDLGNQSTASITVGPALPDPGTPGLALEYPPIGKDTNAQFWLLNPNPSGVGANYPDTTPFKFYFGNLLPSSSTAIQPALEVTFVYKNDAGVYGVSKFFYDPNNSRANGFGGNGFTALSGSDCHPNTGEPVDTTNGLQSVFACKAPDITPLSGQHPVLVRARILYADTPQKLALKPVGASLPPQARIITSIGYSGANQQKLQEFRQPYVVPPYFDFAIFSAADLTK